MFHVQPVTIKQRLQSHGERFTQFCDDLLKAHVLGCGVQLNMFMPNQQVNRGDGGVDTLILASLAPSDQSGFFGEDGTVIQHKAQPISTLTEGLLEEELQKPFAAKCILEGSAFRLFICDTPPAATKTDKEELLNRVLERLYPGCLPGMIVDCADLSALSERYPAVVLRTFNPEMEGRILSYQKWGDEVVGDLQTYVTIADRVDIQNHLVHHIDFQQIPVDGVLTINGDAGVGKTRTAYEAIKASQCAESFVIYTDDETSAAEVLRALVNGEQMAVMVADECSGQTIGRLSRRLEGEAKSRLRVIAIERPVDRVGGVAPEFQLDALSSQEIQDVLAQNFPHVAAERRIAFGQLSGGFIRFAAALCQRDAQLGPLETLTGASEALTRLLRYHVTDAVDISVLRLLSMVGKVGRGEAREQLEALYDWLGTRMGVPDVSELARRADRLHDGVGFVGRTAGFYYVTPEIVARLCFEQGCRAFQDDLDTVVDTVPTVLLGEFERRVTRSAPQEVRERLSRRFRASARSITVDDLRLVGPAKRAESLVETDPDAFVPWLADLIVKASDEQLLAIEGGSQAGSWGPRRVLVWLAERISAFARYFTFGEAILLRLAVNENEGDIGNNATASWCDLYQLVLSGTEVPFLDRLQILRERCVDSDQRVQKLAVRAMKGILERNRTGLVKFDGLGGRFRPREWQPRTYSEGRGLVSAACDVIVELSTTAAGPLLRAGLAEKASEFALLDRFDVVTNLFEGVEPSEPVGRSVFGSLQWLLSHAREHVEETTLLAVEEWMDQRYAEDSTGALLRLVGQGAWELQHRNREHWNSSIRNLADSLLADPGSIQRHIEFLTSSDALFAERLGAELATLDSDLTLASDLIGRALVREGHPVENPGLVAAYLAVSVLRHEELAVQVNTLIDTLESTFPSLAYRIAVSNPRVFHAFERTLRLVGAGKLSLKALESFTVSRESFLTIAQMKDLVAVIEGRLGQDVSQVRNAIQPIWFAVDQDEVDYLADIEFRCAVVRILSVADDNESYARIRIIERIARHDVQLAIELAVAEVSSGSYRLEEEAVSFLGKQAEQHGREVMSAVGKVILDGNGPGKYLFADLTPVIRAIPKKDFEDWLLRHGRPGALAVASSLPKPSVQGGKPVIHPATESLLRMFEDDDEVFEAFEGGGLRVESWTGNASAKFERDADEASTFLLHPLSRVRQWAQDTRDDSLSRAASFRLREEEEDLP